MRRTALIVAGVAALWTGLAQAEDTYPVIDDIQAEPAGPVVDLKSGWKLQLRKEEYDGKTAYSCFIGKKSADKENKDASLNFSWRGGNYMLSVWDRGWLTDPLDPEAFDVTLRLATEHGTVEADAAWEYGVVSIWFESMDDIEEWGLVEVSLAEVPGRSIKFDTTGLDKAEKRLMECVSDAKKKNG
jgi:hypothetical protein